MYKSILSAILAFASCCFLYAQSPIIFSLKTEKPSGKILDIIDIPNSGRCITLSKDKSVSIWDLESMKVIKSKKITIGDNHAGILTSGCLSKDNRYLVMAGYPTSMLQDSVYAFIWDMKEDQISKHYLSTSPVINIMFSHDEKYLVSAHQDDVVRFSRFSTTAGITPTTMFIKENFPIVDICVSPIENILSICFENTNGFSLYRYTNDKIEFIDKIIKHHLPLKALAYIPDNGFIISAGNDFAVNLYNQKGSFVRAIGKTQEPITCLSVSSDGKMIFVGTETGKCYSFTVASKKGTVEITELNNAVSAISGCRSSKMSGSDVVVTAGGNAHSLLVWSPTNGTLLSKSEHVNSTIWNIDFIDSTRLAVSVDPREEKYHHYFDLKELKYHQEKIINTLTPGIKKEISRINNNTVKLSNGTVISLSQKNNRILSYQQVNDSLVALSTDEFVEIYTMTGTFVKTLLGYESAIRCMTISPNKKWLLCAGENKTILFYNLRDSIPRYPSASLYFDTKENWVYWSDQGYYACTPSADNVLGWQVTKKSSVLSYWVQASQFSEALYRPDLLIESFMTSTSVNELLGQKKESLVNLAKMETTSPPSFMDPFLISAANNTREILSRENMVYSTDTTEVLLRISILYGGSGINELNLLQNDKLVLIDKEFNATKYKEELIKEYKVKLLPGENRFKVFTVNARNYKSSVDHITIKCSSTFQPTSDLYMLVIGINEYANATMNLNYGKGDAVSVEKEVKVRGAKIFSNIYTYAYYDKDATLENIKKGIEEIKSKSKLSDVLMVFYAGHGITFSRDEEKADEFYFVTHDVSNISQDLTKKGISSAQFKAWLSEIPASKQFVLLDACHSEASFKTKTFKRGLVEQQAIYQLARSSGTAIIAACGSDQTAKEYAQLGHGAFTYSFLEAISGKADGGLNDGKITVSEIKSYIEDRVPQLTSANGGSAQFPSGYIVGQDFPIVIIDSK